MLQPTSFAGSCGPAHMHTVAAVECRQYPSTRSFALVLLAETANACSPAHILHADQHLESSTKRTLVENETMVAELAYHTAQVRAHSLLFRV